MEVESFRASLRHLEVSGSAQAYAAPVAHPVVMVLVYPAQVCFCSFYASLGSLSRVVATREKLLTQNFLKFITGVNPWGLQLVQCDLSKQG